MQKVEEKMIRGSRISIVLYDMTNGLDHSNICHGGKK